MDLLGNGFNLLLIILGFGFLIFIHELGHFLAAKWAGIRAEAFAVGMGHVVCSWRKGVGLALGTTARKVRAIAGKHPDELTDEELDKYNLGETEYSLRWLPIGGFVKMLGQDDTNPLATSEDPRSYNKCPVGKRMIVVSAGVIMNLILAAVLFVVAFMVGVRFEAPVIGDVDETMPAGMAVAADADALGISVPGIQPGDRVIAIDDDTIETFADLQIASAMARPDQALKLTVQREGLDQPLDFTVIPQKSNLTGLLSIGVAPGLSCTLIDGSKTPRFADILASAGLPPTFEGGMTMTHVDGQPVATLQQARNIVRASEGQPIETRWQHVNDQGERTGEVVTATLDVAPDFQVLEYVTPPIADGQNFELGLLGLTPLVEIATVAPGSPNHGVLLEGDVVLRLGTTHAPRMADFRAVISQHDPGPIDMLVLRDGAAVEVTAEVTRRGLLDSSGMLSVFPKWAFDHPLVARPITATPAEDSADPIPTPAGRLEMFPGTRVIDIAGQPVADWAGMRTAVLAALDALGEDASTTLPMTLEHPDLGGRTTVDITLSSADIGAMRSLGWSMELPSEIFEPVYVTRSAEGNPIRAMVMGVEETHKTVIMTYLTLHRLFIGSVGVKQLRGPVGIIDLGSRILPRGFMYFLFFLGMISVNLAVINFLPLPIVDGGLFLFLIYEKFKGRPPSPAFQNAAMILGLCLIATAFLVVTWNDVARLIG